MKPRPKRQDSGTQELFRAQLRNIINLQHELVRLGELIACAVLLAGLSACGTPGAPHQEAEGGAVAGR